VIKEILKTSKKALSKEDIIEKVLEKKEVKEQTILINLANKMFRRTKDGKYKLS
jgi:DNA-binding winged helix-turn-helix (wHTH) protein